MQDEQGGYERKARNVTAGSLAIFGAPIRLSQNRHKTFTRAVVVHGSPP